ncbi:MAG: cytochrome c3 family protein [Candidatus Omnitrophica bacterium]|nr:cytochrome c3 family protein [Candidatus Omnitrophota bacterium]
MVNRLASALSSCGAAFMLAILLSGCEELVYRDRELFNPPPDTTSGFLGYFNVAEKQTTCGNCHVSFQAAWRGTKHAQAANDLEASGHAQAFCWGCHAVSELGNAVTVTAGYNLVTDSAYRDVQCESCHGPGFEHVQNPSRETRPLASIHVDTGLTNSCGECHSGEHTPYAEQWAESKHGYGGDAYKTEGSNASCWRCHEGRKAILINFNETTNYVELADTGAASLQPILCATCHDPHNAANEGQLRAPLSEPSREQLCVKCHSREAAPPTTGITRRGPHAAQGLLVIDEDAGWIPPNFSYTGPIVATHGSEANPRQCASCHVTRFDVTDASTGEFLLTSVGHTFEPIQCLDAQGLPTEGPCDVSQRDFRGCAVSGCHGSATAARSAFETVKNRMNFLTDQLWADTDGDAIMETTDGGLLPKVLAQAIAASNLNAINLYDRTLTVAEGAIWNAQLAFTHDREYWSNFKVQGQNSCATPCSTQNASNTAHKSSGEGVHNPFLLDALLIASIQAVQTTYGLAPDRLADLTVQATRPPGVRLAPRP